MKISLTLNGPSGRLWLHTIANQYALLSVKRVVTVRDAPKHTEADEATWRDARETLLSISHQNDYPFLDLPDVGEPEWQERYDLSRDFVTKGGKMVDLPGLGRGLVGGKHVLKKGAKKRPTYTKERAWAHAVAWADAFVELVYHSLEKAEG